MGKKDKKGDASDGSSGEEEYIVEKVLKKRIVKGKVRFSYLPLVCYAVCRVMIYLRYLFSA